MDLQQELDKLDMRKSVVIGCMLACVYWFLAYDGGEYYSRQKETFVASIVQTQQKLTTIREAVENQKKSQAEIREIYKNIKKLESYFPKNVDQNELQSRVSRLAEANSIILNKLAMAEKRDSEFPDYNETAVSFEVEGNFHNVMEFISQLTQMNQAIDFSTMQFRTVLPGDFPVVSLSTTLVVYSQEIAPTAPSDGAGNQEPNGV